MDDQQASAVPNTIAELVDSAMAKKPRRRETRDLSNELVTEDQAALEFTRLYSDRLRFDHDAGKWREWNGSIWQENRTGIAFHWARELARDLAKTEDDRVRYVASKTSFASGVERFARSLDGNGRIELMRADPGDAAEQDDGQRRYRPHHEFETARIFPIRKVDGARV